MVHVKIFIFMLCKRCSFLYKFLWYIWYTLWQTRKNYKLEGKWFAFKFNIILCLDLFKQGDLFGLSSFDQNNRVFILFYFYKIIFIIIKLLKFGSMNDQWIKAYFKPITITISSISHVWLGLDHDNWMVHTTIIYVLFQSIG